VNAVVGDLNPDCDHSGHRRGLFRLTRITRLASERIVHPGADPLHRRCGTRLKAVNPFEKFLVPREKGKTGHSAGLSAFLQRDLGSKRSCVISAHPGFRLATFPAG